MNVRAYTEADLEELRRIHAEQGLGYPFPDLEDPTFVAGAVACDERGAARMGAFLQITAQAYLLVDGEHGTPDERWRALLTVHERLRREAQRIGLADVQCWIPPELAKGERFAKRLQELGWAEDVWRNFTYRVR